MVMLLDLLGWLAANEIASCTILHRDNTWVFTASGAKVPGTAAAILGLC